jgi:hypothetical protein
MLVQSIDPEAGPAVGDDDGIHLYPVDVPILQADSTSDQVTIVLEKDPILSHGASH